MNAHFKKLHCTSHYHFRTHSAFPHLRDGKKCVFPQLLLLVVLYHLIMVHFLQKYFKENGCVLVFANMIEDLLTKRL